MSSSPRQRAVDDPANPQAALVQIILTTSPQDEATTDTIERLRTRWSRLRSPAPASTVYVTGTTAASIDFTSYLADRLFVFIGVVLLLSFVLLMMVFRSLLVPLKAVIMNLLSIAAAYGVVVAVFQWGWLNSSSVSNRHRSNRSFR